MSYMKWNDLHTFASIERVFIHDINYDYDNN